MNGNGWHDLRGELEPPLSFCQIGLPSSTIKLKPHTPGPSPVAPNILHPVKFSTRSPKPKLLTFNLKPEPHTQDLLQRLTRLNLLLALSKRAPAPVAQSSAYEVVKANLGLFGV